MDVFARTHDKQADGYLIVLIHCLGIMTKHVTK